MKLCKLSACIAVALVLSSMVSCGGVSDKDRDAVPGSGTTTGSGSGADGSASSSSASGTTSGATGSTGSGNSASGTGGTDGSDESAGGAGSEVDPGSGGTGSGGSTYVDPNCYQPNAKGGAECTQDCEVPCGLADMGTKYCNCINGIYSTCPCPRPPEYAGAPTAPFCPYGDGTTYSIKGTECSVEWEQCIGSDPVSGTTPRGCVCLPNPLSGNVLTWFCGSTNKWFTL